MVGSDGIEKRGQALEDEFFRRVDDKLIANLRAERQRTQTRQELAQATGFQDEALLDHLVDAGFDPASLTALTLVPVVQVAWADGSVTPKERQAVFHAALQRGLECHPAAMDLVESWVHERPPRSLWQVWKEYVAALRETMSEPVANALRDELLRQATAVAKASGGTLGFGKISSDEQRVLDEINAAFGDATN